MTTSVGQLAPREIRVALLPEPLTTALRDAGYRRDTVLVYPREATQVAGLSGDGYRAVTILVDLITGQSTRTVGARGGPAPWDQRAADLDTAPRPLPAHGAVIHVMAGGSRPTYASVDLHPSTFAALPWPHLVPLSPSEVAALASCCAMRSSARQEEYERWRQGGTAYVSNTRVPPAGGDALPWEEAVERLLALKLLARNKAGAVSVTTRGKEAQTGHEVTP